MKFTSILKNIILENSRFEILRDSLTKPTESQDGKKQKPKMTMAEFLALIQADPTTIMNNVDPETADPKDLAKIKAGKYVNWLIKSYLSPNTERSPDDRGYEEEVRQVKDLFMEDLYKVTNDLKKYEKFKNRLPEEQRQIQKLTPADLYELVKDFSLEKTKATKQEKEEAASTYQHPGGKIFFKGKNWTVVEISDKGQLGKDAACFYGGYYLEPAKGETRWCTSSPGLNWFDRYIKDGPLYVVIPNENTGRKGEKTGLPAERYQFHFESGQFMDVHDRQIDLIGMLNGPMVELKPLFKKEFAKGLTVSGGEKLIIDNFKQGAVGKFVALYGLEELFESLPVTLTDIQIQGEKDSSGTIIKIPDSIKKFKNLRVILLQSCINELPESICELTNLRFITIIHNRELTKLPECLFSMSGIMFYNLRGNPNLVLPEKIKQIATEIAPDMWEVN